jgi:transposase
MRVQFFNLLKQQSFNVGFVIVWKKEVKFASVALGVVSIFISKIPKENDKNEQSKN